MKKFTTKKFAIAAAAAATLTVAPAILSHSNTVSATTDPGTDLFATDKNGNPIYNANGTKTEAGKAVDAQIASDKSSALIKGLKNTAAKDAANAGASTAVSQQATTSQKQAVKASAAARDAAESSALSQQALTSQKQSDAASKAVADAAHKQAEANQQLTYSKGSVLHFCNFPLTAPIFPQHELSF